MQHDTPRRKLHLDSNEKGEVWKRLLTDKKKILDQLKLAKQEQELVREQQVCTFRHNISKGSQSINQVKYDDSM